MINNVFSNITKNGTDTHKHYYLYACPFFPLLYVKMLDEQQQQDKV
jgi:hypothetical protein